MTPTDATAPPPANRAMITVSIMLSTIMTTLDLTIANVALPHMAGSVSASGDQIVWVLTSYIVATAIVTPMTGWLAGRFGRKRLFLISIAGFTVASALCGAAQSLEQIVLFRFLQGAFGASMSPLSQAVMFDTYPPAERGKAMSIWGMGVMVAPILGPVLGGWLTDTLSWRWVFYINLPIGLLSLLGVMTFIHDEGVDERRPFDVTGFALLSVALVSFQLFIDRGQTKGWFESAEIMIEAAVAATALTVFAVHMVTADKPFLPIRLLRDRNFVTSTMVGFMVGLLIYSVMAFMPPLMETLLGYPVMTTGMAMMPRGAGSLVSFFLAGWLVNRVDSRLLIVFGLLMFAASTYGMTGFSLGMDSRLILITGFVSGLGMGFIFLPMTTLAFATLAPELRAEGAGVFTLIRNLGSSAGISIMQAMFSNNMQTAHSRLVEGLTPDNPVARAPALAPPASLSDPAGLMTLNGEVTRQAAMVSYVQVFYLMFLITVVMAPLLLLLRKPRGRVTDLPVVAD